MFQQALLDSAVCRNSTRRRDAILLACVLQSAVLAAMILGSMMRTQALPRIVFEPPTPIALPRGLPDARPAGPRAPAPSRPSTNPLLAPPVIPAFVARVDDSPLPPSSASIDGPFDPHGISSGPPAGVGIPGGVDWSHSTPPPPAPVHVSPTPRIVKVGGEVTAARALYRPNPVYPRIALAAHIQGNVVLQAILAKDGSVQDLKVISGHPLLVQAALDAVRQWRYQPTLLNSEPVEVLTEIDVRFSLAE
jgi:protein TonB